MLVTVMGATGKTGKAATDRLLAEGIKVRALGRSMEKLAPLAKAGAQPVVADANKAAELTAAFRGADAVYALVPPYLSAPDLLAYYERVNGAIASAIVESNVRRVVYLSSLGAELDAGTGPVRGLHAGEQMLKAIPGLDLLFMRPGFFYENHFGSLGLIKSQGINGGATAPDVPITTLAASDIGEAVASALAKRDFSGIIVRELCGPRDLTMAEATRILGSKIGKPDLGYVQFPDDGFIAGLESAGFSHSMATLFAEMSHAFNARKVKPHQPRTPANTGTTTFESFAEIFAQAYQAA
ncbi:MAG TPA: NAD(P)H-binding protein [Polyangia bacterium]|jgi:uncharacterized protein YbjT (DUF2867 family)|nr:NAD(P)H-binding protein [Polyangia bacterium]